jgi:4-methyl-5(b-hydroxyethyl)-thiazole monophosphate biosynthesis
MEQLAPCATAVESRVQVDGRVVTSRGPGTTMEFSVALVEQLFGKEKANEVSGPLVFTFSLVYFFSCIPSYLSLLLR